MQDESRTSGQLPQPSLGEFEPGSIVFDDYLIIGKVGAGGMGVVYKATNILLDRNAALKVLPVDTLSANEVLRFQNEARTLSRLEHANIARLFDFGIGDGQRPYLSMEFVEGDTLEDSIEKNGPLPLDLFFEVFIQICEGLAHAHEKGIVHRDVKTSNIMLSVDDSGALRAVLLDFGVAKMADDGGRVTKPGGMIGSPLYISPEQIVGETATVASDIYSLSCVMFCALTGEPPFSGATVLETLGLHRDGKVPIQLLEEVDGIPPELCDLIEYGLSKTPSKRQTSVREMAAQLSILFAQLPDTDFGAESEHSEIEHGSLFESEKSTVLDSKKISDRAAQMLSETATGKVPDSNEGKSKTAVFVAAGVALSFVVGFVGIILFNAFTTIKPREEPKIQIKRVPPVLDDPDLPINDSEITKFEQKTAPTVDNYLNGTRIQSPVIMTTLHEADNARKSPSVKTLELYTAIEEYGKVIELRKEAGPVEAPDLIMARAYIGIYDCELQLRQYNKLAALEKEILKYCPKGMLANEANACVQNAATANLKRKKTEEAQRCLEASSFLLKLNDFKDDAQLASLELNIGTTYLNLNNPAKAKLWLDRSRTHLEKIRASDVTYMACLIRSGVACRALKDYKNALKYFRAAEKIAPNLTKEGEAVYWAHMYYQWAVTLIEMKKYDEAESKIQKGLSLGDGRSSKGLNRLLKAIRKESKNNRQKVTQ